MQTLIEVTGGFTALDMRTLPRYKLILLCAPAGYGKTTLLVDFASHISTPCCWYVLDSTDQDTMVFFDRLLTSIRSCFPEFGQALDPLIARAATAQYEVPTQHFETIITAFISALEQEISKRFVIIFCNYHEVDTHPGINTLLSQLLHQLPQHCVMMIESRAVPSLSSIDSLLMQREVFGLLSDGLRFTAQEVFDLAAQLKYTLSHQEAEKIVASFEGWIAGILLSTRLGVRFVPPMSSHASRPSPAIRVDRKNLFSYVMNEVFKREQEVYDFLKHTSILAQMTPALCNALLNISDAAIHLAYAEQHGFFVTRTNDDAYVCHPVLRELLAEELQNQHPKRFVELHCRAASFFQQLKDHHRAIFHALEAQAYDLAAQSISEISQHMLIQGYSETIARWIDALPSPTLARYPQLLLSRANIWLMQYETSRALPLLDKVNELLPKAMDMDSDTSRRLSAECLIARGFALWFTGQYAQAQEACTQAITLLPKEDVVLRAMAYQQLGVCTCLSGEYLVGITQLQQALQLWGLMENRQVALLHGQLANAYDVIGNYALSEHHRARAIRTCEHLGDIWGSINNQVGLSVTRMHQGNFPDAENVLQQALILARQHHVLRGEAYGLVNLGVLYQDLDRYSEALAITEDGLALAQRLNDRFLIHQALVNLATIYLLLEDSQTALLRLSEIKIDQQTGSMMSYDACLRELLLGTVFLHQQRYDEAYSTLCTVERSARTAKWKRVHIKALIRLAVCQLAQGQRTAAIWQMEQAFALNKQGEYEYLVQIELRRQPALAELMQMTQQQAGAMPLAGHPGKTPSVLVAPSKRCSIFAFGEPTVLLDGSPVTRWRMSRTMELYFFLLDSGRPVRKEHIMTALWQDVDEQNARTLFSTVHYLRKIVGPECIISQPGTYKLDLGEDAWYDVAAFEDYYTLAKETLANKAYDEAAHAYEEMVRLYRGDYLQTVYSDWCIPRRDALRTCYMDALTQLANLAWSNGQFEECQQYWQRLLTIDDCLEEAHYWIMCCFVRQGKHALALRQYHRCKEILQKELSTVPGTAIERLYQKQLQRNEQSLEKT